MKKKVYKRSRFDAPACYLKEDVEDYEEWML